MSDLVTTWAASAWAVMSAIGWQTALLFYDSAPFIMLGCLVAGVLHAFVPGDFIVRYMGGNNFRSVAWAAILGAPVPLCSCSVLPTAMALRKKGASKPAVASFLISVPETDVENIAITYGLMGPVMAVYRPIAGVVTAIAAGMLTILFRDRAEAKHDPVAAAEVDDCCADEAHDHHHHDHAHSHAQDHHVHGHHGHDHGGHHHHHAPAETSKIGKVLSYGFGELLDEIAFWLTFGLVLTGVMLGLLPENFFADVGLGEGIVPMLMMILISVPLYTCASMSAPVGAGLIATGLSPGAALVYLLCGPATSLATLPVIGRLLGARLLAAYLIALIGVAVAAGLLLDLLAADFVREAVRAGRVDPDPPLWAAIKIALTVGFVGLLIASFRRGSFRHGLGDLTGNLSHLRAVGRILNWPWATWFKHAATAMFGSSLTERASAALPHLNARLARGIATVAVTAAVVYLVVPLFVLIVDVGQQGMIQRFGRVVSRDLPPGLYLHWPAPLGRGIAVDAIAVRELTVTAGADAVARGYFLTSDENVIDLEATVQYRVSDSFKATFGSAESDRRIHALGQQTLVELAMTMPIDRIYNIGRATLEGEFRARLTERVAAANVGFDVIAARLVYVHAPADVHDAFRDVASALEDRARTIYEADGDASVAVSQATGRAAKTLADAKGSAVAAVKLAEGKVAPFSDLAAVHGRAPAVTERRLLLETVERRFGAPRKFINGAGAPDSTVDLWLDGGNQPAVKFRFKE